MKISGMIFDGPYDHTLPFNVDFECVYCIINSNNYIVDVGETESINGRMPSHERKSGWAINGATNKSLYILKEPSQKKRLDLEAKIRDFYKPVCGIR